MIQSGVSAVVTKAQGSTLMTRKTAKAQPGSPMPTTGLRLRPNLFRSGAGSSRYSCGRRLAGVVFLSLVLSSSANYFLAYWLGLSPSAPWRAFSRGIGIYRRVGPESGPQVFCAGSSLVIWGLAWPEISESLGEGIENWSVGGSSPEIWEVFQQRRRDANMTIIGVSVYDLNEMRVTAERARYVPLIQTISDLWASGAEPALDRRILTQYAMTYVRFLFPLAGDADRVLAGLRSRVAQVLGLQASLVEHEGVVVERDGVLDATSTMKVSEWSSARALRRIALLRAENRGSHEFFRGPKRRAFQRILLRARQQGPVMVVVFPVSRAYAEEFLDKSALAEFERELNEVMAVAPEATLVRVDRVPGISDNGYFFDFVHLNSYGRRIATRVFLQEVTESAAKRKSQAPLTVSVNPGNQQ